MNRQMSIKGDNIVMYIDPYLNIMFSWDLVDTCYNLHYNFSHEMGKTGSNKNDATS